MICWKILAWVFLKKALSHVNESLKYLNASSYLLRFLYTEPILFKDVAIELWSPLKRRCNMSNESLLYLNASSFLSKISDFSHFCRTWVKVILLKSLKFFWSWLLSIYLFQFVLKRLQKAEIRQNFFWFKLIKKIILYYFTNNTYL